MYDHVKMEQMTWMEFKEMKNNVIILPIGSTEQHGPHLPLSVDTILAEEIAYRLATEINGVVAPALSYGYKSKPMSGGGPLFPGTIDLNGATLQQLVLDLIDEFVKDGFTKIFILSAHYENEPFICEAMDIASDKYKENVTIVLANWWDPISNDLIQKIFDELEFPGWALEHAAITETSLMMYLAPNLVRTDKILDTKNINPLTFFKYPIDKNAIPETGVLASAKSSSAHKGKLIVDEVIPSLVKIVKSVFK
ncbi:MAG: creatininase [Clostridiales bacterium]|nr:creatininase [Clostridiales bacterium]